MMTVIKRNPLAAFTLITFLFSWGFWLPQALFSQGYITMKNPLWGLGSFGPSIAGIIIIALVRGKEGLKGLWLRLLDWRVKLKWYVFIILFPPADNSYGLFHTSIRWRDDPGFDDYRKPGPPGPNFFSRPRAGRSA